MTDPNDDYEIQDEYEDDEDSYDIRRYDPEDEYDIFEQDEPHWDLPNPPDDFFDDAF